MEGYDASTYGDRFADVYDHWYGNVSDTRACSDRLSRLVRDAGGGPALELGVGSGRLALPLAQLGVEVHGIDASPAMLELLAAKPDGHLITTTLGDMSVLDLADSGPFCVVFAAFNTFFNLGTLDAQRRCLARVAEVLHPDGVFVLEAFVPPDATSGPGGAVTPRQITTEELVLTASQHDAAEQTITGQHVHITEAGIRLRPWHLRYATPAQLDELAAAAGLGLRWRASGWSDEPFGPESTVHVSAYGRGIVEAVLPVVARPQ